MIREILIICVLSVVVKGQGECDCVEEQGKPVCGGDDVTYPSFCTFWKTGCLRGEVIEFKCDGNCPCDPDEISKMDEKTVVKLATLRKQLQLEIHAKELGEVDENDSNNVVSLEILESENLGEEDEGYLENSDLYGCPAAEKVELPKRLIDWFHVIKTNEKEQKFKNEGNVQEPILREMKFIDAKLKAMYAKLACADNDIEVEEEVCLPSVKWMFHHLDINKDDNLSPMELLEIEEINSEHCIRPFLKSCDRNDDEKVMLGEFCKCLCVTPPCTLALESVPTVLLNGKPRPFPGLFAPTCDEDGFFMPMQQNKRKGEYWCVNRNGAEIDGSRNKATVKCSINTRESDEYQKLIPLNMQDENAPINA